MKDMTETKAVFFDLDGTLLTPTRGVAQSTRQALIDLRRNGILVGIATGRGPSFALALLEELDLNFAVTYNGQYILDSKNVYYANPMDKKLIQKIIRYAADNHRDLSFGMADGVTGSGLLKFGESRTAGYIAGLLPKFMANFAKSLFKNFVRHFRPVV
jgi:hydroxymethylpyrimidine pyrophosphatase-like HAD family hydrolase